MWQYYVQRLTKNLYYTYPVYIFNGNTYNICVYNPHECQNPVG